MSERTKVRAVVLGGGNVGDVRATLDEAVEKIAARIGRVVALSSDYESAPWGFRAATPFCNRAIAVETMLSPVELLDALQLIEAEAGRDRTQEATAKQESGERYASRRLDLDILLYGDEHIVTERLTVPHALLLEREFALTPLGELLGMERSEVVEMIEKIVKR